MSAFMGPPLQISTPWSVSLFEEPSSLYCLRESAKSGGAVLYRRWVGDTPHGAAPPSPCRSRSRRSDRPWRHDRPVQAPQHPARFLRSSSSGMMTFVGIVYLPPSAESPGAICESPSCTTDATSAPSHVNTLPRAIARPPALDAT